MNIIEAIKSAILPPKRYVIYFTGLLEQGYVRRKFFGTKKADQKFKTEKEVLEFATKFRIKFIAELYCKLYNNVSTTESNFFRVYKVVDLSTKTNS